MKKILLFLFATLATLGLHAEKVAMIAPDGTYTGTGVKYVVQATNQSEKPL